MRHDFEDITSRIKEKPHWWDSNGTPRYGDFHPDGCPNIYADKVVLLEIGCQSCDKRFRVEMNEDKMSPFLGPVNMLHYGDPPNHGCVGDTMNCEDLWVVQVWERTAPPTAVRWSPCPSERGAIVGGPGYFADMKDVD